MIRDSITLLRNEEDSQKPPISIKFEPNPNPNPHPNPNSHPNPQNEEDSQKPPISVKFEIPYFTVSGIQVERVRVRVMECRHWTQ